MRTLRALKASALPTGNLDLHTGLNIIELLIKMNREFNITIICNTHDLKIIEASDRIVWLRDGLINRIERKDEVHVAVGDIKEARGELH